jgi:hypothetical protein
MKKIGFLAALLAPALLAAAPSARAADPKLVAGVETYLRDDEKAILASILIHPDVSAEFDAQAPLALRDPKNLAPFLGVWRAKVEAFAETDAQHPNPDLDGKYSNYAQIMTPEQRAYMVRRLPTMKEDDRNSLIGYLKEVNDALVKNGELTWYTKKVVAGIMDHYRKDLSTYVATPMAQTAKRDAASSAQAFAAIRKADEDSRVASAHPPTPPVTEPANQVAVKPAPKPSPVTTPVKPAPVPTPTPVPPVENGGVATTKPSGGALDQARDAAGAGANGGQVFDGGAHAGQPVSGGAVIVPSGSGTARPTLSPSTKPGGEAGLVGSVPPVPAAAETNFMDSVNKMQTKPAPTSWMHRMPAILGGLLGGLLGGVIGFFVGGPVGAVIGAAAGLAVGGVAGHIAGKHIFQ